MKKNYFILSSWTVLFLFFFVLFFYLSGGLEFLRLKQDGYPILAVVTKTELRHSLVHYEYRIDETPYTGMQSECDWNKFAVGRKVLAFYLPSDPNISCLGNPESLFKAEILPSLLGGLLVASALTGALYQSGYFSG